MDNQDQRKTHTAGHESHGVHVCHKCGWPFPNQHPSARHRRAHKKICGTIEGYKLVDSQANIHLNSSDDEHLSDEDSNVPIVSQVTDKSGDSTKIENFEVLRSTTNDFGTLDLQGPTSSSANISLEGASQEKLNQLPSSSDLVKNLQEKAEGNENVCVLSVPDDIPADAHPEITVEGFKDHERVKLQKSSSQYEEDNTRNTVPVENRSSFQSLNLSEDNDVSSADISILDNSSEQEKCSSKPLVKELPVEGKVEVFPNNITSDDNLNLGETGVSVDPMGLEVSNSNTVKFSEDQESVNENPKGALIDSETNQTASTIGIDDIGHHEENRSEGNDKAGDDTHKGTIDENDNEIRMTIPQSTSSPSQVEVEQSVYFSGNDDDGEQERGKIEKSNITEFQSSEDHRQKNILLTESASNVLEFPSVSEEVMDEPLKKIQSTECTHLDQLSVNQEGIKEAEINNNKVQLECAINVSTGADLQKSGDVTSLEALEDCLGEGPLLSPLDIESSDQSCPAITDNRVRASGALVSGASALSAEDQHDKNLVKQKFGPSGIDASVDYCSRSDSLEGNWGSVSVLSLQSDAPAVTDAGILPLTDSQTSTETDKSHFDNKPNVASEGRQPEKAEMFEPPSFMTLVEPGIVGEKKSDTSEVQTGQNPQHPNSASLQAGWFPSIAQVVSESQGRQKNEEIIAKVTNWSTGKQRIPLKSLLGEAANDFRPVLPNRKENVALVNQKNEIVPKDYDAKKATVNSILGPKSPAQSVREAGKEWSSPARHTSEIKREKRNVKGRLYWIQLMCCSSVDSH
ncbi:Zinc finger, C2H [Quillaja saponaria]|uniref:Zinc finger, C2H n=1 Tax=Quillaja saponaria TaxID=32244 RepID=A0AAD7LG64_QUISA|nr:Zinc finger, C2H [Quillaja saponaria]